MTVQQGMDVARVRQIADQLGQSGEALATIGETGRSQLSVLSGAWSGTDLEEFSRQWSGAETALADAGSAVRRLSRQLGEQAGQQDQASSGEGSVLAGGPGAGPGGTGPGRGPGTPGSDRYGIPWLETASGIIGRIGLGQGVNDIIKAIRSGRGVGALLARIPALSRPVLSAGARLGLFMQASLTSPALGNAAARLFGNSHMAKLFNASRIGAVSKLFSRAMGPLAVGVGAYDLYTGIREGDGSQITSGALGLASVGAAVLLGSNPVGWAVAGGLAVGAFVASQWGDEIAAGAKTAWNWTGDRLSDLGDMAGNALDTAGEVVEDVGSVLSNPVDAIGGLFS